jgi:hypothetical protein
MRTRTTLLLQLSSLALAAVLLVSVPAARPAEASAHSPRNLLAPPGPTDMSIVTVTGGIVDAQNSHIFVSGGDCSGFLCGGHSYLETRNLDGTQAASPVLLGDGVSGPVLMDAANVYVWLPSSNSFAVVSRSTLRLQSPLAATGVTNVAFIVLAAARLWLVHDCGGPGEGILSVKVDGTGQHDHAFTAAQPSCPQVFDDPTHPSRFFTLSENQSGTETTLASMDVTGGAFTTTLAERTFPDAVAPTQIAISPDGSEMVGTYLDGLTTLLQGYDPATLADVSFSASTTNASPYEHFDSLAFSPDGKYLVARNPSVGFNDPLLEVFDATTGAVGLRLVGREFGCLGDLELGLLAWLPDGSAIVTGLFSGLTAKERIQFLTDPQQRGDTITLDLPQHVYANNAVDIPGTLSTPDGAPAAGLGLKVTRYHDDAGVALADPLTDSAGDFTIHDVPPSVNTAYPTDSICYQVFSSEDGTHRSSSGPSAWVQLLAPTQGVSLSAPTLVGPTAEVQLHGTLATTPLDPSYPPGHVVHILRAAFAPGNSQPGPFSEIGTAVVGSDGTYSYSEPAPGALDTRWAYEAAVQASAGYAASTSTWYPVFIGTQKSHLTIKPVYNVGYRKAFTVQVHLEDPSVRPLLPITLQAQFFKGPPQVLGQAAPNADGEVDFRVRLSESATLTASWQGDGTYLPAETSTKVGVMAKMVGHLFGSYARSGKYRLYRPGAHPVYAVAVTPTNAGVPVLFTLTVGPNWHEVGTAEVRLNKRGLAAIRIGGLLVGRPYCVSATLLHSRENASSESGCSFLRIGSRGRVRRPPAGRRQSQETLIPVVPS